MRSKRSKLPKRGGSKPLKKYEGKKKLLKKPGPHNTERIPKPSGEY